jgi:tetratricopeptide (TPR) repeat protein
MESLRISEEIKDETLQAYALEALASTDRLSADYRAAMPRYRRALKSFERAGDLGGQASILRCMGQVLMDHGQFYDAEDQLRRAVMLANDAGASRQASQAMYYLGEAYRLRGDLNQAQRLFHTVCEATRRIDDHVGHGYSLLGLATVLASTGDDRRAAMHLRTATSLAERTEHKLLYLQVLLARAQLHCDVGEESSPRDLLQMAKSTVTELGSSPLWWARCLEAEGRLFQAEGLPGEAVRCWQTAAALVGDIAPALTNRLNKALADAALSDPALADVWRQL